jgi:hypothetical protein
MSRYRNIIKPQLNDRDLAIIAKVGEFKLMTGEQIERVFFYDRMDESAPLSDQHRARNRQRALRRLVNDRILAEVGARRVGGSPRGSATFLYKLDVEGQRIAAVTGARPRRPLAEYRPTFDHLLAIGDIYAELIEAERAEVLRLLQFTTEPYCWRTYGPQTLKPDAFVQVGLLEQRKKVSAFIEVDRGLEWGTKISSKVPQYIDYYLYERSTGKVFPRVLVLGGRTKYLTGVVNTRSDYAHLFQVGPEDGLVELLKAQV